MIEANINDLLILIGQLYVENKVLNQRVNQLQSELIAKQRTTDNLAGEEDPSNRPKEPVDKTVKETKTG